jgi:soluble lytic murein transglycosylase
MLCWISAPIRAVFVLVVLLLLPDAARGQDVMAHVRADRWAEAEAAVALHPDPVARKLVTWMRLMAPGAGRTEEIGAFLAGNPDWPHAAVLMRRRDEALALEPDAAVARAECRRAAPTLTAALLRCADALADAGGEAVAMLRAAWARAPGDAGWETRFIARWASVLTREDHVARFEHLAWTDLGAARRQADRLDRGHQLLIEARMALRRDDPGAPGLVRALGAAQRGDAALMLDHARYLRRASRDDEAASFWTAHGAAAERAAPAARRAEFWAERNLMTRRRLRQGDDVGAYAIAAGHGQASGEPQLDAEFLAGFIALRRLGDAARAHGHFEALADASRSAITQGRAQYWLGRAASAAQARDDAFRRAAAWTSTYYGQLAAHKLSADARAFAAKVAASRDPQVDAARALDLAGRELARAAALLVAWGEQRRAAPFLLQLYEVSPDAPDRALAARLAGGLGLTETAVAIARRAGRDGVMLPEAGWPTALPQQATVPVDAVEKAITLAIIRQESNFDSLAVSPAGARGLMQLMPGTAANVARGLGVAAPLPALTANPELNMRLGTTYLRGLMDQFDANIAMAAAGYNAGPRRVVEWIDLNGDPRVQGVDIIDWIELIPFSETRNYVQRVVENTVIYRARMGGSGATLAHPLAPWLR